jgi:ketosteroid isomerase-like protein
MPEESTTPDPVELTRLAFEAVNQRDIDAVMGFFAPDAVFDGLVRSASIVKSISGRDGSSAGRPMASCD